MTPETLSALPTNTSIAVIGCGDYRLIPEYTEKTGCKFPVYTDPSVKLYDDLGMVRQMPGSKQATWAKHTFWQYFMAGFPQIWAHRSDGLWTKPGDGRQMGGELLFEVKEGAPAGEKRLTWFNRMQQSPDHIAPEDLAKSLGVNAQ